jgi:hypothetical protein
MDHQISMNTKPLNEADRQAVSRLQGQIDELRRQLNISPPGDVLYRADLSYADDEIVVVEANGFGGATLLVVEGNYPVDFCTREEKTFPTEAEALEAADALCTGSPVRPE